MLILDKISFMCTNRFKSFFRQIVQWNQIIPDDEKSGLETSDYPSLLYSTGVHGCTMFGYTDLSVTSRAEKRGSRAGKSFTEAR